MKMFLILLMLLAQDFSIPTPQPLPSPTAYPTTEEEEAEPTETFPLDGLDNSLATIEAELSQPINVEPPTQVLFLANAFGFIRWLAGNDRSLFGPFAPIFVFVLFLTPISLILLIAYIGNLLVTTVYSVASDILKKIQDVIPG